jgi:hypothetical protein
MKMSEGIDILGKIFGGVNKVKVLRFFLLSPETSADLTEISSILKINLSALRKELNLLESIKFISQKMATRSNAKGTAKRRVKVWQLDENFSFNSDLRKILNYDILADRMNVAKKLRGCGRLKLVVLSGVFMNDANGRVDLTVVGDDLNRRAVERAVHKMEADFGKELKYAILETEDFNFRMFSGDKFIRDIFDYPFEYSLNKLGI